MKKKELTTLNISDINK